MKDADTMVLPRLGSAEAGVEDPWDEGSPAELPGEVPAPGRPAAGTPVRRAAAWLAPALLTGVLGALRAGVPGLSSEELATWRAATASWRDDWSAPPHWGDGAITPYHLLIRAWAEVFGSSDLALRVPSIVAMTAAAALLGAVAARTFGPGAGLLAGLIFAILPTSTRYAQEAQPYALTLLAAVLASWMFCSVVDRPKPWRLVAYGGAVLLLGLCHVVALLLLVGHGWVVFAFRRGVAGRWSTAAVLGALPAAALLWAALRDGGRLATVARPGLAALAASPGQLFGVAALGGVLLGLALFSLPLRYPAAVCTAWAVVPPLALLLAAQALPVWSPQLLLFTVPAWAVLGAAALSRVRVRWSVGVVAAIALIGAPAQAAVRAPDGHGPATRHLAQVIEDRWQPGDGVLYRSGAGGPDIRSVVARYVPANRRPLDVLGATTRGATGEPGGCVQAANCLRGVRRLWVIRVGQRGEPVPPADDAAGRYLRASYRVAQVWRPSGFTLALLVDDPVVR